jgi:hypothetical protein
MSVQEEGDFAIRREYCNVRGGWHRWRKVAIDGNISVLACVNCHVVIASNYDIFSAEAKSR